MAKSQNGWPVVTDRGLLDESDIYPGVRVPNGVLAGDVAVILRHVALLWHVTVEPLKPGTCWGWFVKPIEGSTTISNHASGTAIDLNADAHPMGDPPGANMSSRQIANAHAIVDYCEGVVRWGGMYTGRPDPMHWEIIGTPTQTRILARKITAAQEDDMPNANEIAQAVRTVARTSKEFLSDTEKAEIESAVVAKLAPAFKALNDKLDKIVASLPKA